MNKNLFIIWTLALLCIANTVSYAGEYDWLKHKRDSRFLREPAAVFVAGTPLDIDLNSYYEAFQADDVTKIYLGFGAMTYSPIYTENQISQDLSRLLQDHIQVSLWNFDATGGTLSFTDATHNRKYFIKMGHERNEYIEAYGKYHVVVYGGHSRYGRGPTFDAMSNYFRMGNVFPSIEVETQNRYFGEEPLQDTAEYPPQPIVLAGTQYQFQYQGVKDHTSELPDASYTKRIPGYDADLKDTPFIAGKQIFLYESCSNEAYFKGPLRVRFADPSEKIFFGTTVESHYSTHALFVSALVQKMNTTLAIIEELNKVERVYTAY